MLPRVTVREAAEGSRLSGLVLTFVYAAGDIVRVRSDSVCAILENFCGDGCCVCYSRSGPFLRIPNEPKKMSGIVTKKT